MEFILLAAAYFAPAFIAICRGHRSAAAILAVNVILGWTGIGWIVAFIWSLTGNTHRARLQHFPRVVNAPEGSWEDIGNNFADAQNREINGLNTRADRDLYRTLACLIAAVCFLLAIGLLAPHSVAAPAIHAVVTMLS